MIEKQIKKTHNIALNTIGCGIGNFLHSLHSLHKLLAPQPPDSNTFSISRTRAIKSLSISALIVLNRKPSKKDLLSLRFFHAAEADG